jgi:hypothetical protein
MYTLILSFNLKNKQLLQPTVTTIVFWIILLQIKQQNQYLQ